MNVCTLVAMAAISFRAAVALAMTDAEIVDRLEGMAKATEANNIEAQRQLGEMSKELKGRAAPIPTPAPAPTSAAGTSVPPAARIVDQAGGLWTIAEGKALLNGVMAGASQNVVRLYWDATYVYYTVVAGGWWQWQGGGWVSTSDPTKPKPEPRPNPLALHTDGKNFKDAAGNVVNLHGAALIDMKYLKQDRAGARVLMDLMTDGAKGWRANLFKLVVFPDVYLPDPAAYVSNYLQPAIDACTAKKVYCIINWQYVTNPYDVTSQTRTFWADMSRRYKDNPYILFELFSEPTPPETGTWQQVWDTWRSWAQPIVDMIRATAPDNIILVGGPHYSQIMYGAVTNPIAGKNIGYTAHMYARSYHPDANGVNQVNAIGWQRNVGVVADKYPVVASEWGWDNGIEAASIPSFGAPFKAWIDSKGISTCAWIADYQWFPAMFKDTSYTPSEFGQFAKDWWAEKK